MSTEERGPECLEGWGVGRGGRSMEDVTCEMRHEGAHPGKVGGGQREDVQSHTGLKSMAYLGLWKSGMVSRVPNRCMGMEMA